MVSNLFIYYGYNICLSSARKNKYYDPLPPSQEASIAFFKPFLMLLIKSIKITFCPPPKKKSLNRKSIMLYSCSRYGRLDISF